MTNYGLIACWAKYFFLCAPFAAHIITDYCSFLVVVVLLLHIHKSGASFSRQGCL